MTESQSHGRAGGADVDLIEPMLFTNYMFDPAYWLVTLR